MMIWYSYSVLCFIRIFLTLLPQTGYIHPDEYFQSTEILAGLHHLRRNANNKYSNFITYYRLLKVGYLMWRLIYLGSLMELFLFDLCSFLYSLLGYVKTRQFKIALL